MRPVEDAADVEIRFDPALDRMVELERPSLSPLSELSEPLVKVAGIQLNPQTNGPAREYAFRGITLRELGPAKRVDRREVALPDEKGGLIALAKPLDSNALRPTRNFCV